jgi:hypothetical protein
MEMSTENYIQGKMYRSNIQREKIEYSFIQSFFIYSYMKPIKSCLRAWGRGICQARAGIAACRCPGINMIGVCETQSFYGFIKIQKL